MQLRFTKMHGLGNDFVVLDLITQRFNLQSHHISKLADRHFGIGCDQVLVIETPREPDVDFRYRIFNADGNEVEQCGNGARCFAKFVRDKKLTGKESIRVETNTGIIELHMTDDRQVRVDMGEPVLDPAQIPIIANTQSDFYSIEVCHQHYQIGAVSMGNPHAVTFLEQPVGEFPLHTIGPMVEHHSMFPNRVNFETVNVTGPGKLTARVWERGSGETLACGTGACAIAVAARLLGLADGKVDITLPGGTLTVDWDGEGEVYLEGPAEEVFTGEWPG